MLRINAGLHGRTSTGLRAETPRRLESAAALHKDCPSAELGAANEDGAA